MKTIRFTRIWHGFIGRNNWGNKGSAGALPIHWRMGRLDGTDGVPGHRAVLCVTDICCSKTRNMLKNWENQPWSYFQKLFLWGSGHRRHFVCLFVCAEQAAVILFFSWVRGHSWTGKLLYLSFSSKSVSQVWLGRSCSQECYPGGVFIPKGALVTAALPWVSGEGAWGLSWSLLTELQAALGSWRALDPSSLCF